MVSIKDGNDSIMRNVASWKNNGCCCRFAIIFSYIGLVHYSIDSYDPTACNAGKVWKIGTHAGQLVVWLSITRHCHQPPNRLPHLLSLSLYSRLFGRGWSFTPFSLSPLHFCWCSKSNTQTAPVNCQYNLACLELLSSTNYRCKE